VADSALWRLGTQSPAHADALVDADPSSG